MSRIETYQNAQAAALGAAAAIAGALGGDGERLFVATGGRTPWPAYDALSKMDLGWSTVTVTQTDERFVPLDAEESNARLIKQRLLTGLAAEARFLPLKGDGATPEDDALAAEAALTPLLPAAATLLGMGDDGHIGSIFPADPQLAQRLEPDAGRRVVGVEHAGEPPHVPRISLTVRALLETAVIAILITGEAKRSVVSQALADPASDLPIAAILNRARTPVRIFWAP